MSNLPLTDEQIEIIVERVTERVIENVYISVGKGVVKKAFYIIGIGVLALVTWLAEKLDLVAMEASLDAQIEAQKNPVTATGLPW